MHQVLSQEEKDSRIHENVACLFDYFLCIQLMNAIQVSQGKNIFSIRLNCLPEIRASPILSHINPLNSLTPERTSFLMMKMIKMCRPKTIDHLTDAVVEFTSEDSYLNKVLILYILSLLVIPLYSIQKPNDLNLQPQIALQLTILPLQHPDQSGIFDIQFSSRINLTKQQSILAAWAAIKATLAQFSVIIIEQASKKLSEIRYKGPLSYDGVLMPSALRIYSEKDVFLTYAYENLSEGMQLGHYLQLVSLASRQNSQFEFWQTMEKLLFAFESLIKKSSKQGQYYGGLSLDNIFVLSNINITIQPQIPAVRIEEWESTALPKRLVKLFVNNSNPTEKAFASTDRWSVAVILLQAIAIRHRIDFFTHQLQLEEESKTGIDLGKFIAYLQGERYVVDGHFLRKIKLWASLEDQGDHIYYQNLIGPNKSQEDFNNLSFIQLSEIVNAEYRPEDNHEDSGLGTVVALKENAFILPDRNGNSLRQQMALSTQELLLNLKFMNATGKGFNYVAEKLSESELEQLQDRMLSDITFFQMMEFDMKPSTAKEDRCPECLNASIIYVNSCGHGKCKNCWLPLIEISILSKEDEHPFKIKCDASRCKEHFCYSLIMTVLKLDEPLKHKYCQLLLGRYATYHSDLYVCCQQKNCSASSTIYRNSLSRVFFCEACNSAFCLDCRRNCHRPLTCKHFATIEADISEEVAAQLRRMRWSLDDGSAREDERRLREAGLGEVKLADSYRMVWEWLVLHICRLTSSSPNAASQGDFLELLSEKIAYLLREIHRHCRQGTQGDDKCASLCCELLEFHTRRKEILNVVYGT